MKKYDETRDFCDGFAAVKRNDKWGFVNEKGEEIVPCKYDFVCDFSEGFAPVLLVGSTIFDVKWGFVND